MEHFNRMLNDVIKEKSSVLTDRFQEFLMAEKVNDFKPGEAEKIVISIIGGVLDVALPAPVSATRHMQHCMAYEMDFGVLAVRMLSDEHGAYTERIDLLDQYGIQRVSVT